MPCPPMSAANLSDYRHLFRPEAIRPKLSGLILPNQVLSCREKLDQWARIITNREIERHKETELLPGFLNDIFQGLLGYVGQPADTYTLRREALVKVDGKYADAAIGRFGKGESINLAAIEGKGPRDPLDQPFAGRKRSAVEQAMQYAVQMRVDWYLVTNLLETRLYHKGHDTHCFERFETLSVAQNESELKRFYFLLGADRVLDRSGNHLDSLLVESQKIGREVTNDYYSDYRDLREGIYARLREANPGKEPGAVLAATQKMLDRILFIAFCEDRSLLPAEIIAKAYSHADLFQPRPIWHNFLGLFRSINQGNPALKISKFNGGLFAEDPFLDQLVVPDTVCEAFKKIAEYEYGFRDSGQGPMVDVEILGHIFEQSITDLEGLKQSALPVVPDAATPEVAAKPSTKKEGPSKRKKDGAFYTPKFATKAIVGGALEPLLEKRFEQLRKESEAKAPANVQKVFADPTTYDPQSLTKPQTAALVGFWEGWLDHLQTLKIVDPACGSGAFLMEAFDQMYAAYNNAQGHLNTLRGPSLFSINRTILTKNIYGMDINPEAVEIARLSCWIKTAEPGTELTSLDHNIKQTNSLIFATSPEEGWKASFPEVFAQGGFDVVVANPPYVRQEWFSNDKPYLQKHFQAYDGVADLYVYFYELALKILKPGGRLGFIVTNKWMKAGYGAPLRKLYADQAWVDLVVDFGHAKEIFPDADVFPCILIASKPEPDSPAPESATVCAIPREQLKIDDLQVQVKERGFLVPRSTLTGEPWSLEPPGVQALMDKLKRVGIPLKEFIGAQPLYGIKTGFNDAFFIDEITKENLIAADPKSAELFRPYFRGQDIERWQPEWAGLWMIAMKSSLNHEWPWSRSGNMAEEVFQNTYPAIFSFMKGFESELKARKNKTQFWWELSGNSTWAEFDKPKIVYQDITWCPSFGLDSKKTLANNTVYFLPTADLWVLGCLNAPISWAFAWRTAQHGKDEALRLFTDYLNAFPIPKPSAQQRSRGESLVQKLISFTDENQQGKSAFFDWLRLEMGIEKPSQRLEAMEELDAEGFVAEVKKLRGKNKLSVADLKRLREQHTAHILPMQTRAAEVQNWERQLSDLVNEAYGLTAEEVELMWQTAPPRMPGSRE